MNPRRRPVNPILTRSNLFGGLAFLAAVAFSAPVLSQAIYTIPQSTVRAVLLQMAQAEGYAVVWSQGVPDFPTREGSASGDLATAARQVVGGSAYGASNLYCPPSTRFPAIAFTLDARLDENARVLFVVGVPTNQECRPLPGRF